MMTITDTAADLHRYFCKPYCPKCGFVGPFRGGLDFENPDVGPEGCECGADIKPGLHTRDPRTKVEELKYHDEKTKKHWTLKGTEAYVSHLQITDAHAADILVMGVLRVAWANGDIYELIAEVSELLSFPEAVALAKHRMLDAEEEHA